MPQCAINKQKLLVWVSHQLKQTSARQMISPRIGVRFVENLHMPMRFVFDIFKVMRFLHSQWPQTRSSTAIFSTLHFLFANHQQKTPPYPPHPPPRDSFASPIFPTKSPFKTSLGSFQVFPSSLLQRKPRKGPWMHQFSQYPWEKMSKKHTRGVWEAFLP